MRVITAAAAAWMALAVLVAAAVILPSQQGPAVSGATAEGCGPANLPTWNDKQPQGRPFGQAVLVPLRQSGDVVTIAEARDRGFRATRPSDTKNRDLRLAVVGTKSLVQVYSKEPVGASDTVDDVMADGAVYIYERPRTGPNVAEQALAVLGNRAAEIRVGPHKASFSHASPDSRGNRTYNVYWSDAKYNHMVMGNVSNPTAVIDIARSMVCE